MSASPVRITGIDGAGIAVIAVNWRPWIAGVGDIVAVLDTVAQATIITLGRYARQALAPLAGLFPVAKLAIIASLIAGTAATSGVVCGAGALGKLTVQYVHTIPRTAVTGVLGTIVAVTTAPSTPRLTGTL